MHTQTLIITRDSLTDESQTDYECVSHVRLRVLVCTYVRTHSRCTSSAQDFLEVTIKHQVSNQCNTFTIVPSIRSS
jgi:hypothetical protein